MSDKFILTAKDLAEMLGVNTPAVYHLIRRYNLPARKLKRKLIFYRPEVEAWLQSLPPAHEIKQGRKVRQDG